MKLIIAGSRELPITRLDIDKYITSCRVEVWGNPPAIDHGIWITCSEGGTDHYDVSEIVCGTARGPDRAGEDWATAHSVPVKRFPAEWNKYGRGEAGMRRNHQMAVYADIGLVFWDGQSRGSANMIAWMAALNKPCRVVLMPAFLSEEIT